jgi:hypothetical protein
LEETGSKPKRQGSLHPPFSRTNCARTCLAVFEVIGGNDVSEGIVGGGDFVGDGDRLFGMVEVTDNGIDVLFDKSHATTTNRNKNAIMQIRNF